jgi:hypothetical protein
MNSEVLSRFRALRWFGWRPCGGLHHRTGRRVREGRYTTGIQRNYGGGCRRGVTQENFEATWTFCAGGGAFETSRRLAARLASKLPRLLQDGVLRGRDAPSHWRTCFGKDRMMCIYGHLQLSSNVHYRHSLMFNKLSIQ